jgi:iron complex outermembrane receptor protein
MKTVTAPSHAVHLKNRVRSKIQWHGRPFTPGVALFGLIVLTNLSCFGSPQTNGPSALKQLSLEELMDLDVTSVAKKPEPYREAPAAIQVVTGDDIRRSGASSLPEALRLADNVNVAQKNSHDWAISARGFNTDLGNKLLVLMDGRTVYTPLYSGVFWDVQDYLFEDIDRIEVISGPGGTLWGANAVNGVINITTKSAKETQGVYVEGGGGSELRDFGGVRYGGTLASNVFFRVYGKYFDRGSEVFGNGSGASDSWRKGQGGFRLDAEPSPVNALTLQGDFYRGDENSVDGKSHVAGGNVLGRWSHTFSDDSDMSVQLYYDRTHLSVPKSAVFAAPAGTLTDDLDTYDLDFQHHFLLGERNRLVWGLGYRFTHDDVGNSPTVGFLPARLDRNLFNGFVQDEIMLLKNLHLTLGTKIEHNDYTGFELEPSGRLQLNLTQKQMLWAAVSRAVRTPSRIDRDLIQLTGLAAPFDKIFNGGPDFVSETVIAYELGYRAQLGQKVSASISTFYNNYDNVRSFTPDPTFLFPLVTHNNLEGETYGFELTATYQALDWWRLHAGYNLLKEHLRIKSGQVDFSNGLNETADPQQQFSLRSSMDLPQNLEFDASLRWVDTLNNNNGPTPGTVPSYFELDVRIGWHPTRDLELSIVGQSLLHKHHPEYGFPSPAREEIQRGVYGKMTWRF